MQYPSSAAVTVPFLVSTTTILPGTTIYPDSLGGGYVLNTSSGANYTTFNVNGRPSGGEQNQAGGVTINGPPPASSFSPALLVLVDSTTNSTNGSGMLELWENNPNHNSYLLWIHGSSQRNSDEPIRFDGPTWGIDEVNTSTDNAHGIGKWKVISSAYQSNVLQLANSRAWDNTTFEHLLEVYPQAQLSVMPGIQFDAQSLANDSGVLTSSDTSGIRFIGLNGSAVGLTGPQNPNASYQFALPDTVGAAGDLWYNSGNRGGNFNVRQMKQTGSDFTYSPTSGVTVSTLTVSSMTVQNITINGTCTGAGCGGGSVVLASSGIAFGSPTNMVTSDTNTLNYTTTKELIIGTDTATNTTYTSGAQGAGIRLYANASNTFPNLIYAPTGTGSFFPLRSSVGSFFLGDDFYISQNKASVGFFVDSNLGTSTPQMSFQAGASANIFNMFSTSAAYHYSGGDSVVMNNSGLTAIGVNDSGLTASQFVQTDASKNLVSYDLFNASPTFHGAITNSSATFQNITINGTCTGSGCGSGSGGGIVSPGTFTWTNSQGIILSTETVDQITFSGNNTTLMSLPSYWSVAYSPSFGGSVTETFSKPTNLAFGGNSLNVTAAAFAMNGPFGINGKTVLYNGTTGNATNKLDIVGGMSVGYADGSYPNAGNSIYSAFGVNAATGVFSTSLTVSGQNVCQANGTNCPASSGGSSSLAVTTGSAAGFSSIASSPTAVINLDANFFSATLQGTATGYVTIISTGAAGTVLTSNGAGLGAGWKASSGGSGTKPPLTFTWDGGGVVIATAGVSLARFTELPYAVTITSSVLSCTVATGYTAATSTFSVTVSTQSAATFNGATGYGSICAADCPSLSSQARKGDGSLTGWVTSLNAGEYVWVDLNAPPQAATYCQLQLWVN